MGAGTIYIPHHLPTGLVLTAVELPVPAVSGAGYPAGADCPSWAGVVLGTLKRGVSFPDLGAEVGRLHFNDVVD